MLQQKEESKVTVIVACFNGAKYLKNCFQYLQNQTYNNIQLIIVDDGSRDTSFEIMESYRESMKERGFEYIILRQNNGGAASAVQSALKYVDGKYLMLYDVDDVLMRDNIKAKVSFLDQHPDYGMVRNNGYYVRAKNLKQNSYLFVVNRKEKANENIFEDILFARTNNWAGSYMVRTDVLFKTIHDRQIYVSRWGQNLQIILPVAWASRSGFIDKPLMRYVDYAGSVSRPTSMEAQLEMIEGYHENRWETLSALDMSQEQKAKYKNELNIFYTHIKLQCAFDLDDEQKALCNYEALKQEGDLKFKERFQMTLYKTKWGFKVYRGIKHLLKMAWCVCKKIEGAVLRHDELC